MKISVLTLFPEFFQGFQEYSIPGRALRDERLQLELVNIRDYAKNKHKKVDDSPFGGGPGMVMSPQPLIDAIEDTATTRSHVIYLSPQGKTLTQQRLHEFSNMEHVVLVNGHYEGIDQRVIDHWIDEELSIGNYVLSGGEVASLVVLDGIIRLLPGVLASEEAYTVESHTNARLEFPQYTRPQEYLGMRVPDVLLSGNHKNIATYRQEMSIYNTWKKRPDLFEEVPLNEEEGKILRKFTQQS